MRRIGIALLGLWILANIATASAQLNNQPMIIFEGHKDLIHSVHFSPDGKSILTTGDGTMRLWDAATGEETRQFNTNLEAEQSDPDYRYAGFSPDGSTLVAAHGDIVTIFDLETNQELIRIIGHAADINSVDYSPDGNYIVTASADDTIRVWEVKTGSKSLQIKGDGGYSGWKAEFSSDGRVIIAFGADERMWLWDATTGSELFKIDATDFGASAASLSPNGRTLLSWDKLDILRWWDVTTGHKLREREIEFYVTNGSKGILDVNYSPDGRYIVVGCNDGSVRVLEATTGDEVYQFPIPNTDDGLNFGADKAIFSPDGKKILVASFGFLVLWDISILAPLTESPQGAVVSAVEINDSPYNQYMDGVQDSELSNFADVVPSEWSPPSQINPRYLIALIPRLERWRSCNYIVDSQAASVWRFWLDVKVVVTDLTTGQVVITRDFLGDNPQECGQTESFQIGPRGYPGDTGPISKSYVGTANSDGFEAWLGSTVAILPGLLSPDSSPVSTTISASCIGTIGSSSASVNMRNGPGTNFAVVRTVPSNDSIQAIGVQGEWYKVQYQDSVGWIAAQLLSLSGTGCDSLPPG